MQCNSITAATIAITQSLVVTTSFAQSQSDPRIDEETGREVASWPPARPFDHIDMTLELYVPDMSKAQLSGVQRLVIEAIGDSPSCLVLNCRGPVVEKVLCDGVYCQFVQPNGLLYITLPRKVLRGERCTVELTYNLDFSKNRGEGLTYSRAMKGDDSPTRSHPQIHAQGQAELNSRWFPCHDSPNERLTSRLIVTVEDGYDVYSNGRLVSSEEFTDPNGSPMRRWDWVQDKPHAPYLVTLVVGKFATIDLGGPNSARPGLDLTVHTPFGTEDRVADLYSGTAEMVAFFEKKLAQPYPWDRYAQVIVRDFNAGGMENTSCTLMTTSSTKGESGSQDDLISHELAHQWTGDLLTCNSWEHLWLNEGWASYCEALWNEHKGSKRSPEEARRGYQRTIRGFYQSQRFRNKSEYPLNSALVSNRYTDPDSVFGKPEDPYAKGAMLLHMLRMRLGDDVFFHSVQRYINKYKFRTVETDQFRRELEAVSGQSLERFFDQWANRPGLPRLDVQLEWDKDTSTLNVRIDQTQTINAYNPAYAFTLPLRIKMPGGSSRWLEVDMDTSSVSRSFSLDARPEQVSIDPLMTVIAPTTIKKDIAWWIDEAIDPPTFAAGETAKQWLNTHELSPEVCQYLCLHGVIIQADAALAAK